MTEIIGACGLLCHQCDAYLATQSGDPEALVKVAGKWRVEYNSPGITAEGVVCDGCMSDSERHCFHCTECNIRACAVERGLENCAHCPDYACEKVQGLIDIVPQAKDVLDQVRAQLGAA